MPVVDPTLLGWAFTIGFFTFFSPCAWGLIPGYVGYYTALDTDQGPRRGWRSVAAGARFGVAASAGILLLFLLAAGVIALLRRRARLPPGTLEDVATGSGLAVGVLLLLFGVLMLLDRGPRLRLPLKAPQRRTLVSMALFGALFALGSLGCTLPLFLAVLAAALFQDGGGAALVLGAYGVGIVAPVVPVSVGLSLAREQAASRLRRLLPWMRPLSAVLLLLAGAYVLYYYASV